MNGDLERRLRADLHRFTRSEREIATYMLANLQDLPFETAATIAARVGVSQMTVSRFMRTLGYSGIGELKEELRESSLNPSLLLTDRAEHLKKRGPAGRDLHASLQLEIRALVAVYELVGTPLWQRVVETLSDSDAVFVAGFQTLGGIAADFAARLQYLRPEVGVLDGADGTFAALFGGKADAPALVLFEMRRYTRLSQLLAEQASRAGVRLIVICDRHCHWAHAHTEDVLAVNTESRLFWDSQSPFVSLSNLLFEDIAQRLGERATDRIGRLTALQQDFGAFLD